MKYIQTRLPKTYGKPGVVKIKPQVLPKALRRCIMSFVRKPQPNVLDMFWDQIVKQNRKRHRCIGCDRPMGYGCITCKPCRTFSTMNGTQCEESFDKYDHSRGEGWNTMRWLTHFTGHPTGCVYGRHDNDFVRSRYDAQSWREFDEQGF